MKRCQTKHKLYYCWHAAGKPAVADIMPEDFKNLPFSELVTAPNESVALTVYRANLRINRGRK